jgi:hypothetical protein
MCCVFRGVAIVPVMKGMEGWSTRGVAILYAIELTRVEHLLSRNARFCFVGESVM